MSSHALTKDGQRDPRRFRFFATALPKEEGELRIWGQPYRSLVADMTADPRLVVLGIREASQRPPDKRGGLNLEGLTATPEGQMLIGFRNPVPHGKALIVSLLNPQEVVQQHPARFGKPNLLDLGGQGVRALSWWHGNYLIVAGDKGSGGHSRLYTWNGSAETPRVVPASLAGLNPEGFFTPEEREEFMVLSDDGAQQIRGQRCKDLSRADEKRFRGVWMSLASR